MISVKDDLETYDFDIFDYKEARLEGAKIKYCPICHRAMKLNSSYYVSRCVQHNGREICYDCYDKIFGFFGHTYKSHGKKHNIEDVERMKILVTKQNYKTCIYGYIDLTSLAGSGRNTFFGNEKEIKFEYIMKNYYKVPKLKDFRQMLLKTSERARIEGKKALFKNEKFVQYLYSCLRYSFKIGFDKKQQILFNGY